MKKNWTRVSGRFILVGSVFMKMTEACVILEFTYPSKPKCTPVRPLPALLVSLVLAAVTMAPERLRVLLTVINVSF